MNFSIEVTGEEKLSFALRGVAEDLSDFRKIDRPVSDEIYFVVREQIVSAGRSGRTPYPRHAESTVRSITSSNRGRFSHTGELLHATGTLLRAVGTRGAPHGVYEVTEDSLTMGTTLPYARFHQHGTSRMPARPIYVAEEIRRRLPAVVKRAYREEIADRGFDFKETAEIPF